MAPEIVANAAGPVLNLWDLGPTSGLAAEPETGDLAGWLRRGRALAERGDIEAAEAALVRARDIKGRDASPWIEHAAWLYRRGDSSRARDALARAMEALPDDPGRWIDLGRQLGRLGRPEESATVLARARSLCERRLSRAPDDEAAAALAEMLPDADVSPGWTILRPDVMTSAAGATLTRLPDGSVLAGGPNPSVDTYLIEATTDLPGITALRLETMTDPSLPVHGPGRNPDSGSVVLDEIRLGAIIDRSTAIPIHLTRVRSDGFPPRDALLDVKGAIDADPLTGWLVDSLSIGPRRAVFQAELPIGRGPGTRLWVELVSGRPSLAGGTLGRFRLSVTSRPFPFFEPSLRRIKADGERDGPTRLGAAYGLLGSWSSAAAVLKRAAARPDASALDGLLLAVARHHLGRHDEARRDCDRALARLGSELRDDATHDVAIEGGS